MGLADKVTSKVVGQTVGSPSGNPLQDSGPTLQLLGAASRPDGILQLQVRGAGTPTSGAETSDIHAPDHENFYRLFEDGEVIWRDGRIARNIFALSEDFSTTYWGIVRASKVTTGITDPAGGTTAVRVTATDADGQLRHVFSAGQIDNTTNLKSFWMRRITGTSQIRLYNGFGTTSVDVTLTPEWERFTPGSSVARVGTNYTGVRIADSGDVVDIAFAQFEPVDGRSDKETPSEYIKTVFVAAQKVFSHANGNTIASNIVTEAKGADLSPDPSIIDQPEATNSQIQSNDQANAEYTASNIIAVQDEAGFAEKQNACTITATAANGTVIANAVTAASDIHASKWYLKRKTGTGNIDLTVDGGTTWQTVTVNSDYTPLVVDQATVTNPQIGIRIVTSGDAVYVGNAESHLNKTKEEIEFIGPIFTTTVAVTTDPAKTSYDDTNLDDEAGAFYCEVLTVDGLIAGSFLGYGMGAELAVNGDFAGWTVSTHPDNWNLVGTQDANNYVEEHADGMRFVTDGTGTGISQSIMTIGNSYIFQGYIGPGTGSILFNFSGTYPQVNFEAGDGFVAANFKANAANIYNYRNSGAADLSVGSESVREIGVNTNFSLTDVAGNSISQSGTAGQVNQVAGRWHAGDAKMSINVDGTWSSDATYGGDINSGPLEMFRGGIYPSQFRAIRTWKGATYTQFGTVINNLMP